MNKYEIMFIIKTTLESDEIKKTADSLKAIFSDKKLEVKDMGQRKLAYPIKKELSGYYYVLTMDASVDEINEFKHKASINENVLRHLIIRLDEE